MSNDTKQQIESNLSDFGDAYSRYVRFCGEPESEHLRLIAKKCREEIVSTFDELIQERNELKAIGHELNEELCGLELPNMQRQKVLSLILPLMGVGKS